MRNSDESGRILRHLVILRTSCLDIEKGQSAIAEAAHGSRPVVNVRGDQGVHWPIVGNELRISEGLVEESV